MSGNKIIAVIKETAEDAALTMDLEIVDIEFVKEGANKVLRIYIDKEGGVSTEDCEKLSKIVEKTLDEKDPIESAYTLEISSPGLDRQLKKDDDFVKFSGKIVDIKLYKAKNGAKKYRGELIGIEENTIKIIDDGGKAYEFDKSETASVRLAVIF